MMIRRVELKMTCNAQLELHATLFLCKELYSVPQLPSEEKWAVAALWRKLGQIFQKTLQFYHIINAL